jgi:hypothetical protein
MEHLLLKAATTATDEGVFEAVISTATVDRDQDIVEPSAMLKALQKWAGIGKLVPLAWAHTDTVVGHVDPATERGDESWRLVKSGTLSFSFGYLIPKGGAAKLPGGRFRIKELDVYEISVVPVGPANNDTRVLSFKSAEELREETKRVEREVEEQQIPDVPEPPEAPTEPEVDLVKELQEVKAQLAEMRAGLEDLTKKADVADKGLGARSVDPLRQQADAVALEFASGDERLLHPPKTVAPKRPEPALSLKELRDRTRDELLGVLSGGIET